jgi:hypothetical protein
VEWRRGPGFPCGRTRDGSVFCATSDVPEGADVGLVPLPGPPARALGSDGQRWLVLGDDGVVWAHPPPAHGGGRAARVAERVVALASDGWTLACWARADGTTCTDGPRPPAERLAVGTGVACGTGAGGTWCAGVEAPGGEAPADDLVAGTGFACALRAGVVSCSAGAPPLGGAWP